MTNADVKRFSTVAQRLSVPVLTEAPEGSFIEEFTIGVLLKSSDAAVPYDASFAYSMLYAQRGFNGGEVIRGTAGFCLNKQWYSFDRRGIGDAWSPQDFSVKRRTRSEWPLKSPLALASEMQEQLEEAKRRMVAQVERLEKGKLIDFGPCSRRLMQSEIDDYSARFAKGTSVSLTPSGMGTGYRFYVSRNPRVRGRFGHHMPASQAARDLFKQPGLVYDSFDHD